MFASALLLVLACSSSLPSYTINARQMSHRFYHHFEIFDFRAKDLIRVQSNHNPTQLHLVPLAGSQHKVKNS